MNWSAGWEGGGNIIYGPFFWQASDQTSHPTHQNLPVIGRQRLHKNLMNRRDLLTGPQEALGNTTHSHDTHTNKQCLPLQSNYNPQPALPLSGPASLPTGDTAPRYAPQALRSAYSWSSWEILEIHGPRTTPKPGSIVHKPCIGVYRLRWVNMCVPLGVCTPKGVCIHANKHTEINLK